MTDPDSTDLQAWLTLLRAPSLGIGGRATLLDALGDAASVVAARPATLASLGVAPAAVSALHEPDKARLDADLAWLAAAGHHLVTRNDPGYPALLATVDDAPTALFVDGDPDALSLPQLAIVGSRNPTPTGRETAHAFAMHLASRGLGITSGLALGIDSAAHRGALDAGGSTVAVLGTGIDIIYPGDNAGLAEAIRDRGAVVTEFPPGTPPRPANFPRRNRIISGLSVGVVVVEAALRSGSLITARLASEQGREVFAIPGSIHNPLARGCHRLLRDGARLVESAADIIAELGALFGSLDTAQPAAVTRSGQPANDTRLDPEYARLLDAVGYEPTPVDTLVLRTGLTPNVVSSMLLILELNGRVLPAAGGFIRAASR